ncbi:NADH dehydrogenase [ubiquinone] 1 beta subcomplex subunit 1-like [Panthera tigris]|uniref:NADH dehydrogenase [ubiquinone] 1 beta subcomplex subunit 1 n=2 Tax=Panthera TaxID=9688 RepID=A0A8C8XPH1_PANLE|nr:NADH dehydrogenase [ubiquinone] 1 beta subcomplex subunit 1-like [Panthera leo]XP_042828342.1 NADH dehydrogenase [ubiquinone] 1 beta subcomplex subunit 1-like [Panthera tigris]
MCTTGLSSPLPLAVESFFGTKGAASVMNVIQIVCDHWVHTLVPVGFVLGCYLDKKNDEKLTAFQNKSVLLKRELRPSEEVTWK